MLNFKLIIFLSILNTSLHANTIKGYIKDYETEKPLAGVNVLVMGTLLGAATNLEGYYEINNVIPGSYNIQAMYMCYRYSRKSVVIDSLNNVYNLNFSLQKKKKKIKLTKLNKYKEYHKKIHKAYHKDKTLFEFSIGKIKFINNNYFRINPIIKNNFNESVYLPMKQGFYNIYINDDNLENIDLFPFHHFYNDLLNNACIVEIRPDSTLKLNTLYFSKKDLPEKSLTQCKIRVEFVYKFPKYISSFDYIDTDETELNVVYSKILREKLISETQWIQLNP